MIKLKSIFCISLLLTSFLLIFLPPVQAEIVVTTDEANPILFQTQQKVIIHADRAYVFYCNSSAFVMKHRTNRTTWSDETLLWSSSDGMYNSVWLEEVGSAGYLHLVHTTNDEMVYYREGQLLGDGSISWTQGIQSINLTVQTGLSYPERWRSRACFVATDSEGYPIIAVGTYDPGGAWGASYCRAYIWISSKNNGEFSDDDVAEHKEVIFAYKDCEARYNRIAPLEGRKFMVSLASTHVSIYEYHYTHFWNGSAWTDLTNNVVLNMNPYDGATGDNFDQYGTVGIENTTYIVYNAKVLTPTAYTLVMRKSVDGAAWEYVSEPRTVYNWSQTTQPVISLYGNESHVRCYWTEHPDANKAYYIEWNGTAWGSATEWFTETDDIIENDEISTFYFHNYYSAITYVTNATSKNVEFYVSPSLRRRPDYNITAHIRINGYVPYTNVTFQINSTSYADGQVATLPQGAWDIDGTPVTHLSFINWTTSGDISVLSSSDPTTTLSVLGNGVLTQHLNATVAITHNVTTISGMYADNWTFAEESFYGFRSQYILTNSWMDTVMWSFLDGADHNITFYFNNATNEDMLYGTTYAFLRENGTANYLGWINLTDQTLNVTVWVWVKGPILDKLYVDLYVWANCTGYGMTNTTDGWILAGDDYFNIYSKGGLEESFKGYVTGGMPENDTAPAGRTTGGDIFCLYCYNDTWAMSQQYWRHLVHTKLLVEIQWDHGGIWAVPWAVPSSDYPPNFHFQIGWTYYARDAWVENYRIWIDLQLYSFGHGADHQFSQWRARMYVSDTEVYDDYLIGWFDDESDSYKVWIDIWFNKANASSIGGLRAGSYWYGVENTVVWWKRWAIGNDWGILNENITTIYGFASLKSEGWPAPYISSTEIELMKLWCKVYQSSHPTYNYSCRVWKIHDFDYTYDSNMIGIPTPSFEPPKMPSMPVGGFLGVIYSALMWIAEQLGPGVLMFWYAFVSFMDSIAGWLGYPGAFTNFINWMLSLVTFLVNAMSTLLTILVSLYEIVTGPLVTFLIHTGTLITHTISSITGMITYLSLAYNDTVTPLTPAIIPILTLIGIMLPFYELVRMEEQGFEILFQDINMIFDLFAFFVNLFISVVSFFLRLVSNVIEAIPVIE